MSAAQTMGNGHIKAGVIGHEGSNDGLQDDVRRLVA